MMSFSANKISNEYADAIPAKLFKHMSKDVFAAVAFSLAMRLNADNPKWAIETIVKEWEALYASGIVPQKPAKVLK